MAFEVIRKTTIIATDSLLTLAKGEKVEVACTDFAPLQTVHSAASRLNARAGFKEFEITTPDIVTHHRHRRQRRNNKYHGDTDSQRWDKEDWRRQES